jgi:hypothetical protein
VAHAVRQIKGLALGHDYGSKKGRQNVPKISEYRKLFVILNEMFHNM